MSEYSEFFLNAASSVVQLECLEISHPSFSKTYRVVRNAVDGITVKLETAAVVTFSYYPLRIAALGTKDDLDSGLRIDLGDLGEILPLELDRVVNDASFHTKPIVKYRTYRSDDLIAPMVGPFVLEVTTFSFSREGASFEAKAPSININQTGELYKIDRFSGLRGFL